MDKNCLVDPNLIRIIISNADVLVTQSSQASLTTDNVVKNLSLLALFVVYSYLCQFECFNLEILVDREVSPDYLKSRYLGDFQQSNIVENIKKK